MDQIESTTFCTGISGPQFLILGSVHGGTEKCGTLAIRRLKSEIECGSLILTSGQLTLMGPCNPQAFSCGQRFIDRDLNRDVVFHVKPRNYEDYLANQLVGPLTNCNYLLDLHSSTSKSEPFAFINGDTKQDWLFTAALAPSYIITGWTKAYLGPNPDPNETKHITTTVCAASNGAVAVTFENGQNEDPQTTERAYQTAIRGLLHLGMINSRSLSPIPKPLVVEMESTIKSDGTGRFVREWKNLDYVTKGTVLAVRGDGEQIIAEKNMVIVLPRYGAKAGESWMYPARVVSRGISSIINRKESMPGL